MKILMICGVYSDENEQEVLNLAKGYVEQSANIFQKKLISGIEANHIACKIISAPLIGAYPMRNKRIYFNGFLHNTEKIQYVPFNNIWGIRNFSRAKSLKKAIKAYLKTETEEEFLILVYCPHTPFLEAAVYTKALRPKSKICFVVPDLPQYMNLNEHSRGLYDFFKKYDIKAIEKYTRQVDSFVLLTDPMKDALKVGERPYIVVEGLIDESANLPTPQQNGNQDGLKRIVYTGKLNTKFGITTLVDSFMKIKGDMYRLILCGDGDAREYVEAKSKIDTRICYMGVVTSAKASEYIKHADVLVNPRPNNETYTKYSFPSKNIEYLMSGKPVVAYMLDGMPKNYKNFIFEIPGDGDTFEQILLKALQGEPRNGEFFEYAKERLTAKYVIGRMVEIFT